MADAPEGIVDVGPPDHAKAGGTCIVQFSMALPHIPQGPKPGMLWREALRRLTLTFAWEENQIRFLAERGIRQFALPVPEDLFERDER